MAMVQGTISKAGQIVASNVQINLNQNSDGTWGGSFDVSNIDRLDIEHYQLALNDGRKGDIGINYLQLGNKGNFAEFIGESDLQ